MMETTDIDLRDRHDGAVTRRHNRLGIGVSLSSDKCLRDRSKFEQ